jgi:hypothetical protein
VVNPLSAHSKYGRSISEEEEGCDLTSADHSSCNVFTLASSDEIDGPWRGVHIHHKARNLCSEESSDAVQVNVLARGSDELKVRNEQSRTEESGSRDSP